VLASAAGDGGRADAQGSSTGRATDSGCLAASWRSGLYSVVSEIRRVFTKRKPFLTVIKRVAAIDLQILLNRCLIPETTQDEWWWNPWRATR
jgi:hypothetical protein